MIAPSDPPQTAGAEELMGISEAMWQIAQARFSIIRPLPLTPRCTLAQVRERAGTAGVNHVTVYR